MFDNVYCTFMKTYNIPCVQCMQKFCGNFLNAYGILMISMSLQRYFLRTI